MKLFKYGLILLLILLSVSVVSAVQYTAPSDFHQDGGAFVYGDYEIYATPYDSDDWFNLILFENSDGYEVYIGENNIANYTDYNSKHVGVLELVDINGEECIVDCYYDGTDSSKLVECNKYLEEFNKLNNVKPKTIEV